ncbi:MAG TPA: UDP-N-acetylglucosamine--N-acetylmuramyl-(pentapeptide) pyrophosphoryl-undecaprenol N-acetylglucosamine transferase [Acidimicrobiales bacterium]|nr:UDP-N-acetylglucosamine--N-acetylmuramyl-(pentapeptide) pyrophosphoryl-undecaprenol N-acetylglucosamine transferase [Acidimicrobiales bacterium]
MSARRGTVIAGGGTGGHIVPSLQIARAMVERGHPPDMVELYGSRRGQEARMWPTLEFPYTLLPGRGIRRSLRPGALWANLGATAGLVWACVRAFGSFARRRPRVAVIVGGYASFPAGLAAVMTRVPLVCVNTDAVPGAVNRVLGRFAAANAVAFDGTGLPRSHVTGTPVLPELSSVNRSPAGVGVAREALGLPDGRTTIAAVGGSLGALRVNRAVADLAGSWAPCAGRALYHVTGRRDYDEFARGALTEADGSPRSREGEAARDGGLFYKVVPFEDQMPQFYAAADVYVTRAGAMTVAELLVAGVPAILVPLPGAPRDHQTRNAEALVGMGAAVHLPDAECDGKRLAEELEGLLADPARLRAMSEAARRHGHRDAAARVAELVDAHAR